jgi:thiol:disulfide interchange protein
MTNDIERDEFTDAELFNVNLIEIDEETKESRQIRIKEGIYLPEDSVAFVIVPINSDEIQKIRLIQFLSQGITKDGKIAAPPEVLMEAFHSKFNEIRLHIINCAECPEKKECEEKKDEPQN